MARSGKRERARRRRAFIYGSGGLTLIIVLAAVVVLSLVGAFLHLRYHVKTVRVDGNTRYTDEEIESMVLERAAINNTLYLRWRFRDGITNVPFVERMDVQVVSHDTVHVRVYEKALAGYFEYLGQYMYFDREGVVVEATKSRIDGVPQVMGLRFGYVVLYERLPVDNEDIFARILNITQLLEKYSLAADRIFFDAGYNIYLYFGNVEAELGGNDYINEKVEQLVHILPELDGKRGIIRMKDWTPSTRGTIFEER